MRNVRSGFFIVAAVVVATLTAALPIQTTFASQITNRSMTLVAGATDGGSKPGGVVNHKFDFTLPGGSNVGSIKFEYCTTEMCIRDRDGTNWPCYYKRYTW